MRQRYYITIVVETNNSGENEHVRATIDDMLGDASSFLDRRGILTSEIIEVTDDRRKVGSQALRA